MKTFTVWALKARTYVAMVTAAATEVTKAVNYLSVVGTMHEAMLEILYFSVGEWEDFDDGLTSL